MTKFTPEHSKANREAIFKGLRQSPATGTPPNPQAVGKPIQPNYPGDPLEFFTKRLAKMESTVKKVNSSSRVEAHLLDYLSGHDLPTEVVTGPDSRLDDLITTPTLKRHKRPANKDDKVGLSYAEAGISESGTLILKSGAHNPASVNYLVEHHIVLVNKSTIVKHIENAMALVKKGYNETPRGVYFISSSSSTADIQLTLERPSHGPKTLHVMILMDR